jgi:hypothetical protein
MALVAGSANSTSYRLPGGKQGKRFDLRTLEEHDHLSQRFRVKGGPTSDSTRRSSRLRDRVFSEAVYTNVEGGRELRDSVSRI